MGKKGGLCRVLSSSGKVLRKKRKKMINQEHSEVSDKSVAINQKKRNKSWP